MRGDCLLIDIGHEHVPYACKFLKYLQLLSVKEVTLKSRLTQTYAEMR